MDKISNNGASNIAGMHKPMRNSLMEDLSK